MTTKLTKSIEDLLQYFAFSGRVGLPDGTFSELNPVPDIVKTKSERADVSSDTQQEERNPALTKKIRDLIIDATEGGRFISDFAKDPELVDANTVGELIRICYD